MRCVAIGIEMKKSLIFRAKKIADLGGYRDVYLAEDYDLWLRAIESKLKIQEVKMSSVIYVQKSGTMLTCVQSESNLSSVIYVQKSDTMRMYALLKIRRRLTQQNCIIHLLRSKRGAKIKKFITFL